MAMPLYWKYVVSNYLVTDHIRTNIVHIACSLALKDGFCILTSDSMS